MYFKLFLYLIIPAGISEIPSESRDTVVVNLSYAISYLPPLLLLAFLLLRTLIGSLCLAHQEDHKPPKGEGRGGDLIIKKDSISLAKKASPLVLLPFLTSLGPSSTCKCVHTRSKE